MSKINFKMSPVHLFAGLTLSLALSACSGKKNEEPAPQAPEKNPLAERVAGKWIHENTIADLETFLQYQEKSEDVGYLEIEPNGAVHSRSVINPKKSVHIGNLGKEGRLITTPQGNAQMTANEKKWNGLEVEIQSVSSQLNEIDNGRISLTDYQVEATGADVEKLLEQYQKIDQIENGRTWHRVSDKKLVEISATIERLEEESAEIRQQLVGTTWDIEMYRSVKDELWEDGRLYDYDLQKMKEKNQLFHIETTLKFTADALTLVRHDGTEETYPYSVIAGSLVLIKNGDPQEYPVSRIITPLGKITINYDVLVLKKTLDLLESVSVELPTGTTYHGYTDGKEKLFKTNIYKKRPTDTKNK